MRGGCETSGDRYGAVARKRTGDRKEVIQVHRERVLHLADLERRRGRDGRDECVDLFEDLLEVAADERAHLEGAAVVGVVVAAREHVGAHDDAALHLGAEALRTAARVEVEHVVAPVGPVAVAHAVEAREVRARLGGSDDVIDGHRVFGMRQAHLHDLRAGVGARLHGGVRNGLHLGVEPVDEVLLRKAELHALQRSTLKRLRVVGDGDVGRGAVHLVVAREDLEEEGCVRNTLRHGANLVERTCEGGHAEARDASVARLEAHAVAEARRLADGAAGIGAEGRNREIAADSRRAAAGAAARHARRVAGVHRATEGGVLGGGPHRELVHVHASRAHRARRLQVLDHRRVVGAHVSLQNLRAARAGLSAHVDQVLDGDGDSEKRGSGTRAVSDRIRRLRRRERARLVEREIRADLVVMRVYAVDDGLRQLHRRKVALREPLRRLFDS